MRESVVCLCTIAAGAEKGYLRQEVRHDATSRQTPFDSDKPVCPCKQFPRLCSASHHYSRQRRHVPAIHLQWSCWQSSLLCLHSCRLSSEYRRSAYRDVAWLNTEPHGFCHRYADERAGGSEAIYCCLSAANQQCQLQRMLELVPDRRPGAGQRDRK